MDCAAHPLTNRLDPGDVIVHIAMHLDFQVSNALVDKRLRIVGHFLRRLDRQDAQNGNGPAQRTAEQNVQRHCQRASQQIVQRAINRRLALRRTTKLTIQIGHDRRDMGGIAADDAATEMFELGLMVDDKDPICGLAPA